MKSAAYCLFATPLGSCGIAWTEDWDSGNPYAVTSLQLPEATAELTESRIALNSGAVKSSEIPLQVINILERVCKHLNGDLQDFRDIPVDLDAVGPFVGKVCEAAREIPVGQTVTYADLATSLGRPTAVRAVGRALGRNPIPLIIPCHRVLAADGKPGGFSAHGGRATKAKLLAIEGAVVNLCLELEAGS
ncbi:MAG TPA: methylated-DNA--[protein]-cysteine S-methyltransferase [Terriglobia bacterium]|nr:methylated-DNA--[protein]-cysteine S-methyltransferase [Terriglobia bacterium]